MNLALYTFFSSKFNEELIFQIACPKTIGIFNKLMKFFEIFELQNPSISISFKDSKNWWRIQNWLISKTGSERTVSKNF